MFWFYSALNENNRKRSNTVQTL